MKGIRHKSKLEFREPLDGVKRQKVFYDITQEHPAEIYRLEEYSAFVIRKDSEGVFIYLL